jgi:hypothetical protein
MMMNVFVFVLLLLSAAAARRSLFTIYRRYRFDNEVYRRVTRSVGRDVFAELSYNDLTRLWKLSEDAVDSNVPASVFAADILKAYYRNHPNEL